MEVSEYTQIFLEGAFSILLLVCAYKLYRSRISTESDCKKSCFNFHMKTDTTTRHETRESVLARAQIVLELSAVVCQNHPRAPLLEQDALNHLLVDRLRSLPVDDFEPHHV